MKIDELLVDAEHALIDKQTFWALEHRGSSNLEYTLHCWRSRLYVDHHSGRLRWVLRWFAADHHLEQRDIIITDT